jgi:hypothetical protein
LAGEKIDSMKMMEEDEIIYSPWFVLAESIEQCWSCSADTKVFAILIPDIEVGSQDEDESSAPTPYSLTNIVGVNDAVERFLKGLSANFYLDYSSTSQQTYWMNHCEKCTAKLGDFFLHHEPGHAFFPMTNAEMRKIKLNRIDIALEADAGWGQSSWIDDLLAENGF